MTQASRRTPPARPPRGCRQQLHGDFHPRNVPVRHGRVVPIDFQDAIWGFVEQDLAITLVMLDRWDPTGTATTALRSGDERRLCR